MQNTEKCNDSRIVVFSISQMRPKQKKVLSANLLAKQPKMQHQDFIQRIQTVNYQTYLWSLLNRICSPKIAVKSLT